ncbi:MULTISPECIES: hypothetical protein [unclassified Nocardia]|uniref:hypothetical protein n=1 Tax=unclassified Nocardia TaxID=2637762 RepID=UPI0024A932BC|nr:MULTISPECIES: hypothetical protein [unclassified Nocardia]
MVTKINDSAEVTAGVTRPPAPLTAAAVGALAAALLAALWFGGGWVRAAYFTDGPRADAREAALAAACQAAINMTTIKIDDIPGSLALARSSMTGAILDSADQNREKSEEMARQAGVGMESQVQVAALTSLNSELDRATALVVMKVTETKQDKSTSSYRYSWSLDMIKDGDVWKTDQVASLTQPVLLDNSGAAPEPPIPAPVPEPAPTTQPGS